MGNCPKVIKRFLISCMDVPKWPWVLQKVLLPLVAVLMGLGVLGWFSGYVGQKKKTPGVVISFSKSVSVMERSWRKDLEELVKLFLSL